MKFVQLFSAVLGFIIFYVSKNTLMDCYNTPITEHTIAKLSYAVGSVVIGMSTLYNLKQYWKD